MKMSVVIGDGVKQIMMTPETDHEKEALGWIAPTDTVKIATQWGTYDSEPQHYSYNTSMSQGGVLRRYAEKDSLMFVLTPKEKPVKRLDGLTEEK